ncbi:MAG: squalene/phytoene synthase family protein [Bacteroidota bacterium]
MERHFLSLQRKNIYDLVSAQCSRAIARAYTTSFALGIKCLHKQYHQPIYAIYSFFRLGDEIVDSFQAYPRATLLKKYKVDTYQAIADRISLNPVLNAFQHVVHDYQIGTELIDLFFDSMEMDLTQQTHTQASLEKYLLGSSEVVGLMCLQVFCKGDKQQYIQLKPYAIRLGKALQKVNFLRDLDTDYKKLGRTYFPHIDFEQFSDAEKRKIEQDIAIDFQEALIGIKLLPIGAKFGVYIAYKYYKALFRKICSVPSSRLLQQRIRLPSYRKYAIALQARLRYSLNYL